MPDNSNYQFRAVPLDLLSFVTKKPKSAKYYFRYLLDRTLMMFEYKNLPDTIDSYTLERYLQVNGVACVTKAPDNKIYCFNGSWGGPQDVYYRPTKFIISNPHLSQLTGDSTFTKECTIFGNEPHDAVLMRNDKEWASLTPLIARYAVLMCENTITVRSATIMLRCLALLSAASDKEYKSALAYLAKLEAGELGVISSSSFTDGVKMQSPPSNNGSYLTQFIELQQYLKGSFFNELGLRANYNMKREAIGLGESTLDADSILPLCDNMLKCRQEDIAEINNLFGLDIEVSFSSAWLENRLESSINIVSQLTELTNEGRGGSNELGEVGGNSSHMDQIVEEEKGETNAEGNEGNTGSENEDDGNGKTDGRDGEVAERSGSEVETPGEPGEGRTDGDARNENGSEVDDGDAGRGEEVEDEKNDIKEELDKDELTIAEAAVEVVNEKVSQLIADVREGGV